MGGSGVLHAERKAPCGRRGPSAPGGLEGGERADPRRSRGPPHRQGHVEQRAVQPGMLHARGASRATREGPDERTPARPPRTHQGCGGSVAWVGGGAGLALGARASDATAPRSDTAYLRALRSRVRVGGTARPVLFEPVQDGAASCGRDGQRGARVCMVRVDVHGQPLLEGAALLARVWAARSARASFGLLRQYTSRIANPLTLGRGTK